jgi:hypothetical protein
MSPDVSKQLPLQGLLFSLGTTSFVSILVSELVPSVGFLANAKRILVMIGFSSAWGMGFANAQLVSGPYQYRGGIFAVNVAFNFNTNIVTDSVAGTTRLQPILTITNTDSGRSITTSFIGGSDFISTVEGNVLIGKEVIPGRLNPRTNTATVTVDASALGPGPLTFSLAGISELSGRAPGPFRNVFGGPFYVWTIFPQSLRPNLPPWKPPLGGPGAGPPVGPTATNIHAVIISGRSDPAKVVTASTNVTLTGGIVALGKSRGSSGVPSTWAPGLRIVADDALLTGKKIPPVTPNIIDVRIVKHEVTDDLTPDSSPAL